MLDVQHTPALQQFKRMRFLGCWRSTKIMSGWKTYKYYYETDELPNPRPTQPKKKQVKSGIWATFCHNSSKYFFAGWG